jgi:hypothetical protein
LGERSTSSRCPSGRRRRFWLLLPQQGRGDRGIRVALAESPSRDSYRPYRPIGLDEAIDKTEASRGSHLRRFSRGTRLCRASSFEFSVAALIAPPPGHERPERPKMRVGSH